MSHVCYTVQRRDLAEGLMGIARRFYGDEAHWVALYEANRFIIGNNPAVLRAGQQMILPDLIGESGPATALQLYEVAPDDVIGGLPGIAARLWGRADSWAELYALNRGAIGDDPAALQPGQWLILPHAPGPRPAAHDG